MKAKYPNGTRVRVTEGHTIWNKNKDGIMGIRDIRPELKEDKATVLYTYGEKYGQSSDSSHKSYCLDFDKYGQISWFSEDSIIPIEGEELELSKLPTLEEFEKGLAELMYGKNENEGARQIILITMYTQRQVDKVVGMVGGWDNLANHIANKRLLITITQETNGNSYVSDYVSANLSVAYPNVRVASFKPIE